jgi:hypothetical protein
MILGQGLYENSDCVFFFRWAVFFSFSSCFFYSATAIETGIDPGGPLPQLTSQARHVRQKLQSQIDRCHQRQANPEPR